MWHESHAFLGFQCLFCRLPLFSQSPSAFPSDSNSHASLRETDVLDKTLQRQTLDAILSYCKTIIFLNLVTSPQDPQTPVHSKVCVFLSLFPLFPFTTLFSSNSLDCDIRKWHNNFLMAFIGSHINFLPQWHDHQQLLALVRPHFLTCRSQVRLSPARECLPSGPAPGPGHSLCSVELFGCPLDLRSIHSVTLFNKLDTFQKHSQDPS